jgi:hypothetical protein
MGFLGKQGIPWEVRIARRPISEANNRQDASLRKKHRTPRLNAKVIYAFLGEHPYETVGFLAGCSRNGRRHCRLRRARI